MCLEFQSHKRNNVSCDTCTMVQVTPKWKHMAVSSLHSRAQQHVGGPHWEVVKNTHLFTGDFPYKQNPSSFLRPSTHYSPLPYNELMEKLLVKAMWYHHWSTWSPLVNLIQLQPLWLWMDALRTRGGSQRSVKGCTSHCSLTFFIVSWHIS